MALVSGSPAPLKDVRRVQFGIISPDELVSTFSGAFLNENIASERARLMDWSWSSLFAISTNVLVCVRFKMSITLSCKYFLCLAETDVSDH